jgi:hypothetical protein
MLPGNASSLLMAAGLALAVFLLMRRAASAPAGARLAEAAGQDITNRLGRGKLARHASASETAETPVEVLRWQVEMHETARELKGQIDSKLSALQALIILARREAERLEEAIHRAREVDSQMAATAPRDTLARLQALADPAAIETPRALAAAAAAMQAPSGDTAQNPFENDGPALEIARRADAGQSAAQIAQELGMPLGEVELRLGLRPA